MSYNTIYLISKRFSLKIIELYSFLYNEQKVFVISKQIYRSGTSRGANIAESIFAQSDAEYANKLKISLKEVSETR